MSSNSSCCLPFSFSKLDSVDSDKWASGLSDHEVGALSNVHFEEYKPREMPKAKREGSGVQSGIEREGRCERERVG